MVQIPASKSDLQKAARCHKTSMGSAEPLSRKLLLFYAVECALKYAVLENDKRKRTTNELEPGSFGCDGHNLYQGLKGVRVFLEISLKLNRKLN